jgi:hypothetical protein
MLSQTAETGVIQVHSCATDLSKQIKATTGFRRPFPHVSNDRGSTNATSELIWATTFSEALQTWMADENAMTVSSTKGDLVLAALHSWTRIAFVCEVRGQNVMVLVRQYPGQQSHGLVDVINVIMSHFGICGMICRVDIERSLVVENPDPTMTAECLELDGCESVKGRSSVKADREYVIFNSLHFVPPC